MDGVRRAGIEPALEAWEASVLPLDYRRPRGPKSIVGHEGWRQQECDARPTNSSRDRQAAPAPAPMR